MNKELIKKYKTEFDHWLNGGKVISKYTLIPTWSDCQSEDIWRIPDKNISKVLIVINDEYATYRKALAEGKVVEVATDYNDVDGYIWKSMEDKEFHYFNINEIRIKPEEPKFKVGDWVVYTGGGYCDGEILQITKIDEKGFCTFGSYNKLYHFNKLRRWKPKPDEWCWVFDDKTQIPYLRKFVCINNNVTRNPASYSYKVEYESNIVSYKYIEPFIGALPSTIEQY